MIELIGPGKGSEVAARKSPVGEGDDGEHPDEQGQAEKLDPVHAHCPQSPASPLNGREEPAEQEKKGHREPVDGTEDVNVDVG